jgi:cation diffusion facilitator CzcD-associated flavoprotein CzcO
MSHLRSPSSHNLDLDFHALRAFAREGTGDAGGAPEGPDASSDGPTAPPPTFIPPYARPTLGLFNRHAEYVMAKHDLAALRRRDVLLDVDPRPDAVEVKTTVGVESADYVILAVGRTGMPYRPGWARAMDDPRLLHVFDPAFTPEVLDAARMPVVIGGGVTAAQVACHAARRADAPVRLVTRGPITVEQFDSEPCYIGPRCLAAFLDLPTAGARRRFIEAARHPGTMPWDVAATLRQDPRIRIVEDRIASVDPRASGIRIDLADSDTAIESDLVILATGFEKQPPLAPLIADLTRRHGLATGPAGYPAPDQFLRWHPRVLVAGPLGELELGPAAPNIIGAHLAARRLVPFFRAAAGPGRREVSLVDMPPAAEIAWTALTHYLHN